jgi:hypothetical protein
VKKDPKLVVIPPAQAIIFGLGAELVSCVEDIVSLIKELWTLFPNVWAMADAIARVSTSLLGRILAVPFRGYAELYANAVEELYGSRLMRPSDAVRLAFRAPTEVLQAVTATDETGLFALLLTGLARSTWRLFKRSKLLILLLRVKSEEDFVRLVLGQLKRKANLIRWVVIFAGIVAVSTLFCLQTLTWGFTILLLNPQVIEEYLLPQNSKRIWSRKGRQMRVNARRGPD